MRTNNDDAIVLFPVNEAMQALGVGRTTFYKLVKEKRIDLVHIGKKALVTRASLTAFVASLKAA